MNETPSPDAGFTTLVEQAIRRSLAAFQREHADQTLAGYAVCTDDELITLSGVATSHEYLATVADPCLRYSAVEWPFGHDPDAFDAARAELVRRNAAADLPGQLRDHVVASFQAIVAALEQVRASGDLGDDVLVYLLSTDPSPFLESLERQAVRRLNSPQGQANWQSTQGGPTDGP